MSRRGWSSAAAWDRRLLVASLALALISAVVMASAASSVNPRLAIRHWTWMGIGLALCWGVANTDYRRWLDLSIPVYGVSLIVLAIVLGGLTAGAEALYYHLKSNADVLRVLSANLSLGISVRPSWLVGGIGLFVALLTLARPLWAKGTERRPAAARA